MLLEIIGIIIVCFIVAVIAGVTRVSANRQKQTNRELDEMTRRRQDR